jgi:ABC-2 type transport system ATP-binding protein
MTTAIETFDLTRRFGRTEAVNGLNLQVPAGSIFALLGPNGAGKTTTLKLLMNLVRATRGRATVLGVDTRRLGPTDFQRIGYVSENQRLPEWMTPGELFDYCRPLYPAWDDALRGKLQSDLGLTSRAPLRTLSRGTRMKAALLASLAYRPDLVVLDEPFTGLDPLVRDELVRGLLEVSGERSWTVLISSHDIDEVERLADWVGFISEGRLLFAEPVPALLGRFRLVEVVSRDDTPAVMLADPRWLPHGTAGRTLRFIDTHHDAPDAASRIASAFPASDIRTSPLPLREIFVILARNASTAPATASPERAASGPESKEEGA